MMVGPGRAMEGGGLGENGGHRRGCKAGGLGHGVTPGVICKPH